jgi:1-aminocyclopropane-1-carboxylate deaminase/D-cysteine desulfhydrase-like pyridoxal-dependent ACC family enzyme
MGTQAGWWSGRDVLSPFIVYGVAVEHPVETIVADGVALANATAAMLGLGRVGARTFSALDIMIDGDSSAGLRRGDGRGLEAIRLLARTEAIFLDPVYSG